MRLFNFKKLTNWEYWPWYMFYIPNIPYAFYLALRAKSLTFFTATNPAIKYSGNGSESKFATVQLIPETLRPLSIFIKANENVESVVEKVIESDIGYPLIIKPDVGFRGFLVKQISNKNELETYLKYYNCIALIIQEYVSFKNECGIIYYRLPHRSEGKITSITLKKFLSVKGDGKSTLIQLINADKRAKKYMEMLTSLHARNFETILKKGEKKVLSIVGNHSKGTQFINGNHLIDKDLEKTFATISNQIHDWYYGRLDIKYNSFDLLKQGKDFKIIEINGIISEPTHIYDSEKSTYFNALKEIRKHWKIVYKIATFNHSLNSVKYNKVSEFINSLKQLRRNIRPIKKQHLSS